MNPDKIVGLIDRNATPAEVAQIEIGRGEAEAAYRHAVAVAPVIERALNAPRIELGGMTRDELRDAVIDMIG